MHAMGEISETAFKPLRFAVWNIKHNAPCKSIACLEWRIWRRERRHGRERISKSGGREGGREEVSDLYLSFPYSCSVCICVCTSKISGSCAFAPLSSGVGLQYSASPQHTWFAPTKGPNGSIFYCGVWEQAERERERLFAPICRICFLFYTCDIHSGVF